MAGSGVYLPPREPSLFSYARTSKRELIWFHGLEQFIFTDLLVVIGTYFQLLTSMHGLFWFQDFGTSTVSVPLCPRLKSIISGRRFWRNQLRHVPLTLFLKMNFQTRLNLTPWFSLFFPISCYLGFEKYSVYHLIYHGLRHEFIWRWPVKSDYTIIWFEAVIHHVWETLISFSQGFWQFPSQLSLVPVFGGDVMIVLWILLCFDDGKHGLICFRDIYVLFFTIFLLFVNGELLFGTCFYLTLCHVEWFSRLLEVMVHHVWETLISLLFFLEVLTVSFSFEFGPCLVLGWDLW